MKKTKHTGKSYGFYRLSRNATYCQPFNLKTLAFIDLMSLASFEPRFVENEYKERFCLHPGQLFTSNVELAKRWGKERRTVARWLKDWVAEGLITIRNPKKCRNTTNTIISITYYSTGGYPNQEEKKDVPPETCTKVASINDLQNSDEKNVPPERDYVPPETPSDVPPESEAEALENKDESDGCPF